MHKKYINRNDNKRSIGMVNHGDVDIKAYKSATYINPQKNSLSARIKNSKLPLIKPIFSKQGNKHYVGPIL